MECKISSKDCLNPPGHSNGAASDSNIPLAQILPLTDNSWSCFPVHVYIMWLKLVWDVQWSNRHAK